MNCNRQMEKLVRKQMDLQIESYGLGINIVDNFDELMELLDKIDRLERKKDELTVKILTYNTERDVQEYIDVVSEKEEEEEVIDTYGDVYRYLREDGYSKVEALRMTEELVSSDYGSDMFYRLLRAIEEREKVIR